MLSIKAFYLSKDDRALGRWNGGEGLNTGGCSGKVGVMTDKMPVLDASSHRLSASLLAADLDWSWGGGGGGMRFRADGTVRTPRGDGTWGAVPSQWRKDSVHVSIGEAAAGAPKLERLAQRECSAGPARCLKRGSNGTGSCECP